MKNGLFSAAVTSCVFVLAMAVSPKAFAYYSVMDNAEVMPSGHYKVTGESQFLTDGGSMNFAGRFDAGINEETGVRAEVGFGDTDVSAGAYVKFVPYPDYGKQPAIGMNLGVLYGRDGSNSEMSIRLEPLISKKFEMNFGALTPYGSLPVSVRRRDGNRYANDRNDVTLQLVAGTQVYLKNVLQNIQFLAEVGLDLNEAPAYFSIGAVWYFDKDNGFQWK